MSFLCGQRIYFCFLQLVQKSVGIYADLTLIMTLESFRLKPLYKYMLNIRISYSCEYRQPSCFEDFINKYLNSY